MKKLSDEYHKTLDKYNSTQDRPVYQEYIAINNRLMSAVHKITFTGPENLRRAQLDYFNARDEYKKFVE